MLVIHFFSFFFFLFVLFLFNFLLWPQVHVSNCREDEIIHPLLLTSMLLVFNYRSSKGTSNCFIVIGHAKFINVRAKFKLYVCPLILQTGPSLFWCNPPNPEWLKPIFVNFLKKTSESHNPLHIKCCWSYLAQSKIWCLTYLRSSKDC